MFAQLLLILINNYNYTMKKVEALMISVSVLSHRLVFPKKKKMVSITLIPSLHKTVLSIALHCVI